LSINPIALVGEDGTEILEGADGLDVALRFVVLPRY
jgi:hypothetical protein